MSLVVSQICGSISRICNRTDPSTKSSILPFDLNQILRKDFFHSTLHPEFNEFFHILLCNGDVAHLLTGQQAI